MITLVSQKTGEECTFGTVEEAFTLLALIGSEERGMTNVLPDSLSAAKEVMEFGRAWSRELLGD